MIIVTGGAGFIGSAFVAKLNAQGITDVVVVDEAGASEKSHNLRNRKIVDYINKEEFLNRVENERALPEKISAIVHMGACSSTTEKNVAYLTENNYRYSQVLCDFSLRRNIRFIYASSAATYGDGAQGYADTETELSKFKPLNPYGDSKQIFDQWAVKTGALKNCVGLKFFNVYGPNEYHKGEQRSVVNKAFQQIQSTGKVQLFRSHRPDYKDGEQKRDFIYIKDCNEVMWWLFNSPAVNGLFNLGTGLARTWNDLANAAFSALGRPPKIDYIDMPPSIRDQYQYFTQAEMIKLGAAGCPVKFTPLEVGVKDYVNSYLLQANPYL